MEPEEPRTLLDWLLNAPWRLAVWVRHWDNPAPSPDATPIYDKHRRKHWLEARRLKASTMFDVSYRGQEVGQAGLFQEDEETLSLDDIKIEPRYQKRGIGTILLTHVEQEAINRGAKEVTGRIVRHDLDAFPGLLAWYERNGYAILPPGPKAQPRDVAQIRRTL